MSEAAYGSQVFEYLSGDCGGGELYQGGGAAGLYPVHHDLSDGTAGAGPLRPAL